MNKTVNINLANILFHIDEEAYNKMRRYLEAIKRSFANTSGSDEILSDIEARIAELFQEKMENDRQVITVKVVDEVINTMGQPEDYQVDEDIFEDAPPTSAPRPNRIKKLYRDPDSKYIGGVCSGMEHYMGLDALWIRLIWIFLTIFTWGGFVIFYVLLWILVPEAITTSQKLDMRGEPVNISNIERKVKEGFDDVASKVKSVDYEKMGNKVKSTGKGFFDTLGDIIMFFFKVLGKFIGIILIIVGASSLIALFIGLFTVGILDMVHIPGVDFYDMVNSTDAPVWLVSLLGFFVLGIPFFFLLYLGLKILVNNLNSIGNIAKFSLLGLWFICLIALIVLGVKQASAHAYTGSTSNKDSLYFEKGLDTLSLSMRASELYETQENTGINGMTVAYNENGDRLLFTDNIRFDIKKSEDSLVQVKVRKDADGSSFADARKRAEKIDYSYSVSENTLVMDNFLTTDATNKVRDQEVNVTVYVPENTVLRFAENSRNHIGRSTRNDHDLYRGDIIEHLWKMDKGGVLICLDCTDDNEDDSNGDGHIIIDENGVDIDIKDQHDNIKVKINENGVHINSNEN